ncbi:FGGY-family carbohydrate kinase [Microbacterium sp.]|uniref:FGGY-family carbohydrate kinase n=1 Tax=Microbacterium sp. TaxID=51671 RepID=UPI003F9DF7E2
MTESAWVGIDLGTQSVRAIVLDDDGRELAAASAPLHSSRVADRHEQDPQQWLVQAKKVLQKAVAELPPGYTPRAVAVSGTSGTLVPLDRETGSPRGPAVMYDDRRGAPHLERVAAAGAGLWQRLGYRMQASWGLPKLLELLDERADDGHSVIGHQPDVVTSMLAGHRVASDLSSALKTGADLDSVSWPEGVLDSLGISLATVNALAASGSVIGEVGESGAAATGLPVGCLIVAGMTDGCAAQLSAGALTPGAWNSVLGTTLVLKGVSAQRHTDPTGAVYAHRAPFDGGWYPGGASNAGAGVISELLPGRDLAALTAAVDFFGEAPIAYPLRGRGERFPFVASDAVALLPNDGDDVTMFSAILHGVAYVERLAFDLLAMTGYDLGGSIYVTGGGARNTAWTQLRADTLQSELNVPVQSEGAAGMAMLAAAGCLAHEGAAGADPLATVARRMAPASSLVEPRPQRREPLAEAYSGFIDNLAENGWLAPELCAAAREGLNA